MAIWRSALLEELLGGPLDGTGLTAAALQRLCDEAVVENDQLEFKGAAAYDAQPKSEAIRWRHEQDVAKDICAFANHRGGVIVIGINEAESGTAGTLDVAGRPPSDGEHRRLNQALQQHSSPSVAVDFVRVPVGESYATAVVVPPSDRAPHGVSFDPKSKRRPLCFPVREGADTRYLSEVELADRYHRRFLGAADRVAREERVVAAGRQALRRSSEDWCFVAVVPAVATPVTMNRERATSIRGWLHQVDFSSPLMSTLAPSGPAIPAPGRLTFTDHPRRDEDDADQPRGSYVELHTDGAFFGARALRPREGVGVYRLQLVDAVILLCEVGLGWALEQVGSWGGATVIAGLHIAADSGGADRHLELWEQSAGSDRRIENTRRVSGNPFAESLADLSVCATVQDRMVVAYEVGSGLMQHFGMAEMLELAPDGAVQADRWTGAHQQAANWAERYGVPLGNSTVRRSPYAPSPR